MKYVPIAIGIRFTSYELAQPFYFKKVLCRSYIVDSHTSCEFKV
jgi:hypothetical protein